MFMLHQYEANKDPQKTVNLLKVIQWTYIAWEHSVIFTTIQKYQRKSILLDEAMISTNELSLPDNNKATKAQLTEQITLLSIKNLLSLYEFINPEDKVIVDEDGNVFEVVVQCYSIDQEEEDSNSSEEEVEEVNTITAL